VRGNLDAVRPQELFERIKGGGRILEPAVRIICYSSRGVWGGNSSWHCKKKGRRDGAGRPRTPEQVAGEDHRGRAAIQGNHLHLIVWQAPVSATPGPLAFLTGKEARPWAMLA
jgi:hypothetical protein